MSKNQRQQSSDPIKADLSNVIEKDGKFFVSQVYQLPVTETPTVQVDETVLVVGADIEPSIVPKPRVTSFVPRSCSCCSGLRAADTNYSRVTSTQGNIRYCKCTFCGNTWKEQ